MNPRTSHLELPEHLKRWRQPFLYCLLLSVTYILYAGTLSFQFVWDDVVYVTQNYRIQGLSLPRMRAIWSSSYLGHYAPVHHTFLALLHSFSGMDPYGYHLGQLLLHAACVFLVFFLLQKMEPFRVAYLAAFLFAVHPANIETVAWISETKSTLSFLFFMLSFWAYLRFRNDERWRDLILCALFLILSLLSKINTVVAPAIFLFYDYWQGFSPHSRRIRGLISLFLISVIFVAIHLASFHGSADVLESSYVGGFGAHILNLPFLIFFYIRMAIYPHPLSAWHMIRFYDRFDWLVGAAWVILLALAWILYGCRREVRFWALWFLVFLAPVLQIIAFPVWVADRYLYIPAIGIFVLASKLFIAASEKLAQPWQRLAWELLPIGIILSFAWQTKSHLPIWRNDLALWEATVPTCETSPYCHSNLGLSLLQAGQTERGVKELIRAVEIRPAPKYLIPLGDAYTLAVGDYRQALIAYGMALERDRSLLNGEFYAKLARAYLLAGKIEQAGSALQAGSHIDPNDPSLLVMSAIFQWKNGNLPESRKSLNHALVITGQYSNAAAFIGRFWANPSDVGKMLADLRHSQ